MKHTTHTCDCCLQPITSELPNDRPSRFEVFVKTVPSPIMRIKGAVDHKLTLDEVCYTCRLILANTIEEQIKRIREITTKPAPCLLKNSN